MSLLLFFEAAAASSGLIYVWVISERRKPEHSALAFINISSYVCYSNLIKEKSVGVMEYLVTCFLA